MVQSYDGTITVSGGGAANKTVAASGTGVNAPVVTAGAATGITLTFATVPGTISFAGCGTLTDYGVEYSTTNGFANGTGTQVSGSNLSGSNFSVNLSGLTQSTTYYFHTYATSGASTGYSAQGSFVTFLPPLPRVRLRGHRFV